MSANLGESVARVWPDGASSFEVLGGGITNHNLNVTRPEGVFVLRIEYHRFFERLARPGELVAGETGVTNTDLELY